MTIDPEREELITLAEASRCIPNRPDVRTVWRWIERGCRGVVLDSIRIGGRRYTSAEAIERFLSALNATDGDDAPKVVGRANRIKRAKAELAEQGV